MNCAPDWFAQNVDDCLFHADSIYWWELFSLFVNILSSISIAICNHFFFVKLNVILTYIKVVCIFLIIWWSRRDLIAGTNFFGMATRGSRDSSCSNHIVIVVVDIYFNMLHVLSLLIWNTQYVIPKFTMVLFSQHDTE